MELVVKTLVKVHSITNAPVPQNRRFFHNKFDAIRKAITLRNGGMKFSVFNLWLENQVRNQFGMEFNLANEMQFVDSTVSISQEKFVFCHNDFFVGNILQRESRYAAWPLVLASFDLCGYNDPAYDFAQLFNSVYLEHAHCPENEIEPFNAEPFKQLRFQMLELYDKEIREMNPQWFLNSDGTPITRPFVTNERALAFQTYSTLVAITLILASTIYVPQELPVRFSNLNETFFTFVIFFNLILVFCLFRKFSNFALNCITLKKVTENKHIANRLIRRSSNTI
jgi:hypothetical protein